MISRKPTHPGVVLLEDVIKPLGLTITDAARMLGVSRKALSEFVNDHQTYPIRNGCHEILTQHPVSCSCVFRFAYFLAEIRCHFALGNEWYFLRITLFGQKKTGKNKICLSNIFQLG